MSVNSSRQKSPLPTTLGGQLKRQSPRYAVGFLLLGTYQYAQYWFDTRLSRAIDAATHDNAALASRLGAALIGVDEPRDRASRELRNARPRTSDPCDREGALARRRS